jgi:hypothetical protein
MLFKRQKPDIDAIVQYLAAQGFNKAGESLFLDSQEISRDLVLDFVKACKTTEHAFRFAEDVLRFANLYNALVVFLRLKDKALEEQILARLSDPALFLSLYEPKSNEPKTEHRSAVGKGFGLFLENLEISERLIMIGAHEILAARFMHFVSNGNIGKEDDTRIWLIFSLGIYNHLQTLPQTIARSKQKLRLK